MHTVVCIFGNFVYCAYYYDNTNNEYNPPLHLSLAEIHMMREFDNYKEDIEYDEDEEDY